MVESLRPFVRPSRWGIMSTKTGLAWSCIFQRSKPLVDGDEMICRNSKGVTRARQLFTGTIILDPSRMLAKSKMNTLAALQARCGQLAAATDL